MTSADRRSAEERLGRETERGRAARAALVARARALVDRTPVEPLALLDAIGAILPDDAVVIEEATSSAHGIRELIRSDDPQAFFGLRGGAVGWGMPAAIGVKLALPDRPVLALIGDGGAMYTCQALWTAAHDAWPSSSSCSTTGVPHLEEAAARAGQRCPHAPGDTAPSSTIPPSTSSRWRVRSASPRRVPAPSRRPAASSPRACRVRTRCSSRSISTDRSRRWTRRRA